MRIHQMKLEQIATRSKSNAGLRSSGVGVVGPQLAKAVTKEMNKRKQDKARSKDFMISEKNFAISKDN